MKIAFIGDVSKDLNVIKGQTQVASGGGVFYGAIAAQRLGAPTAVYTKCARDDQPLFQELSDAGVEVSFLPTRASTSIRNVYPSDNPDERTSAILSKSDPVTAAELEAVDAGILHINPLWLGLFPPELIPLARKRAKVLGGDAQGFLRQVQPDGQMKNCDWADKARWLPHFDVFKVDSKEAKILTGLDDKREAARQIHGWGAKLVLLTHQGGVMVHDGKEFYESPWLGFTLEGRTGRGDTCTASFLVALSQKKGLAEAAGFAAKITSEKMQYKGPYRG